MRGLGNHYSTNGRYNHLVSSLPTMSEAAMNSLVVFVHIPKASGTSFRNFLIYNYGKRYQGWLPGSNNLDDKPHLHADLRAVSSHQRYGFHEKLPLPAPLTPIYVSIVRDPVARFVSTYNFITTFKPHPLHEEARNMAPDDFFPWFVERRGGKGLGKMQCSFIAGKAGSSFDDAKNNLDAFEAVVDISQHDDLVEHLSRKLDLQSPGQLKDNASPKKLSVADLSDKLRRDLECMCDEDIRLVDYVKQRGIPAAATN